MQLKNLNTVSCDVLVIGGGGASLWAALEAREMGADVAIASKVKVGHTNNTYISGGIIATAGLAGGQDNTDLYLKDTIAAGRFLNNQKIVALVAEETKAQLPLMEARGVDFARDEKGLQVQLFPGHSMARHVSPQRPRGLNYNFPLKESARKMGIKLLDRLFITRLYTMDGHIAGASGVTDDGGFLGISAKCVVLATGGYAHVYPRTSNAPGITGDGLALAFDLGVPLLDLEFVQFYPTGTGKHGNRMLFYEQLVFHAGARLKNAKGEDIITKHKLDDPMAITRDRLAQAMAFEIFTGLDVDGGVVLDLSPVTDDDLKRLSGLIPLKWTTGKKAITVAPTTHFCMGGVMMNGQAETTQPGLFAAGEVCAGVHGANRLAGNALAEVFAMGGIAGRNAAKRAREIDMPKIPPSLLKEESDRLALSPAGTGEKVRTLTDALKEVMWTGAGVIRDADSLRKVLSRIEELKSISIDSPRETIGDLKNYLEFRNMLQLSDMICRAALLRTESRGSHYRDDFPEEDNINWLKNIVVRKEGSWMVSEAVPVSLDRIPFEEK
jgi:succinate dehydrogenase/fumarate reductase flavoprotein subunit